MTEILSIGGAVSPLNVRNSAQPVSVPETSGSVRNESFISSRIRVDNLLDLAILEFRSQEGEVLRQFPTQGQIQAFQRAAELDRRTENSFEPVNTNASTGTPQSGTTTGAALLAQNTVAVSGSSASGSSAPAPLTSTNTASLVSSPAAAATTPSTSATQSVVV